MSDTQQAVATLSRLLAEARQSHQRIPADTVLPTLPDDAACYAVQQAVFALTGEKVGGWKIGAKSPDAAPGGAPLAAQGVHKPGVALARDAFPPAGLELEIAFKLGKTFVARAMPYSDEEVRESIAEMGATIELVATRFAAWPDVEKRATSADFSTHGALIVGNFVPYRDDFPFVSPQAHFRIGDTNIVDVQVQGKIGNSAGDPRRLLSWAVNYATTELGIDVTPDTVLTTGTFTGMYLAQHTGEVRGEIVGLPPVGFELV
ncbi:2-keto-4-pentenoate hydratase [Robbsia sp. KACC 23696]|uniref:2-keto-4-pentenoate hydratase n=1 Tax=Robbsia sp. KACC 23696 TaxID=3149231 RepID=UPI00325C2048